MTTWNEDEHIEMGSPSLLVVPPKAIHTSRNVNDTGAALVDIFAPPRMDFSLKPGMVCNAADYPMPTASQ
jgi:mannose-6-phosphate isomerase-like protein (cupin superfamily)